MTTKVTQAAVVAVYNQLSRYVAANHTAASARRAMSDLGFMLGCKALERLLAVQPTLELAHPLEERDIIKFVCKELWEWLFGKQADRLQTNKKGGYVIVDQTFRWSVVEGWSTHSAFYCAIIRGVLCTLGVEANVAAELKVQVCE
ncbi:MAG: hypothetical protein KVP17_001026 [Porospora cf. gigantea B]|uniref:uncharacterized protein n=1 Tax=Porospora cf. gigantea B TaxID=2853592 RepID=UPI003571DB74|nr:MAG: hypothetical protein KVP17_001026 [Porospora cf. gigantea B]